MIPGGRLEAYWLLRHEAEVGDDVQTLGGRLTTARGAWDAELEAAAQFETYGDETHRGSMIHGAFGYTAAALNASRFGVAYNFGSGNGDPSDGTHRTFDHLYPLNHAFYGYMDFFALQNLHNVEATFNTVFGGGLAGRVAYQGFWLVKEDTDAWYNAGAGVVRKAALDVASYVGSEIDITLRHSFFRGQVAVEAGYGRFLEFRSSLPSIVATDECGHGSLSKSDGSSPAASLRLRQVDRQYPPSTWPFHHCTPYLGSWTKRAVGVPSIPIPQRRIPVIKLPSHNVDTNFLSPSSTWTGTSLRCKEPHY